MWDAQTGQELLSLKGHTGRVIGVVFNPDGNRLASASRDKTVKVWDAQTGQELFSFKIGPSSGVAFSPDGKRLATSGRWQGADQRFPVTQSVGYADRPGTALPPRGGRTHSQPGLQPRRQALAVASGNSGGR